MYFSILTGEIRNGSVYRCVENVFESNEETDGGGEDLIHQILRSDTRLIKFLQAPKRY